MPRKPSTKDKPMAEALTLLEIDKAQLKACPRIEHLFKGIGGKSKVMEYLSGSEEPEARAILVMRERLTVKQHNAVPFEAYCVAAGLSVKKVFGVISSEVMEQSAKATAVLAAASHPKVVQATIDMALTPLGDKDRKMLHLAAGFVPVPKNSFTSVKIDARGAAPQSMALPPIDQSVKALSSRLNEERGIAAPADIIEGDVEEDDDDED